MSKTMLQRWITLAILAIAAVWGVYACFHPSDRPPGVPPDATEVVGTEHLNWAGPVPWLSDHELLHPDILGATVIDTHTGVTTRLSGFSDLIEKPGLLWNEGVEDPWTWRLSPDKKWLLWQSHITKGKIWTPAWIAARLDGSKVIIWPRTPFNNGTTFAWMPDSRHWVGISDGWGLPPLRVDKRTVPETVWSPKTRVHLYSLDTHTIKDIPADLPQRTDLLAFTSNGDALVFDFSGAYAGTDIYRFSLVPNAGPVSKVTLRYPVDAPFYCAVAPQGDRIAWLFHQAHPPPESNVFEQILSFLTGARTTRDYTLWISGVDGSNLHQASQPSRGNLEYLQWTPDGTKVSGGYWSSLWTIPVH